MFHARHLLIVPGLVCGLFVGVGFGQSGENHLPVYIEDSPAAQELVDQADTLREQGRMTDAVATLQRVIDEYGSKLMPAGDGLFGEASLWVRQRLLASRELLASYRQVYGPEAERLVSEAGAPPAMDRLERVFGRFFLTDAGLEAGLLLAGRYLERADAAAAQSVLDDLPRHPSFATAEARHRELASVAALLAGDDAALATHRGKLRAMGADAALEAIDGLAAQMHPPLRVRRAREGLPRSTPDEAALERPLWTVRASLSQPEQRVPYTQPTVDSYPIVPAADGDRLFINENDRIYALDRFSGRMLWEFKPDEEESPTQAVVGRMGRTLVDRRSVLIHGRSVVAVLGQATVWPIRADGAGAGTHLLSLDRDTGEVRWRVSPQDLDAGLGRAYFQGTPLATADRVFVLMRRNQTSGFQDAFVAAVDASTGRPLWRRHVSSAVTASRFATTSAPQMMMHGGLLYVSDNLAAVAAIEGRTGALLWTRLVLTAADANTRGLSVGGDAGADAMPPVMVEAGLIVPPVGSRSELLCLDPMTGELRATVPLEDQRAVSYLLPVGDDVLGVGRRLTLFDGQTLEPRWTARLHEGRGDQPRTQAAVTAGHVVAATGQKLLLIDRETGEVVGQAPLPASGNVVALDGQLLVADTTSIRAFMAWGDAYAALNRQALDLPRDPGPGLAMAHLAATHGRAPAVLEGVDLALAALNKAQRQAPPDKWTRMQKDAFAQVLEFADGNRIDDTAVRRKLFNRLASISGTASQEVAYHLALGRLLEQSRQFEDAVEHYQAVLLDDTLGSQLHHQDSVVREASLEAQRRLERVVAAHGRSVYNRFNVIAAARLAELRGTRGDAQAFIDLARRYPLADAAAEALADAASRLAQQGREREAATQLRHAFRRANDNALAAELAGRLAALYEDTGRVRQAMHWLRRVGRERPDVQPLRRGEPVSIDEWLDALTAHATSDHVGAALRLPLSQPYMLGGLLMTPTQQPTGDGPPDVLVLRSAGMLRLYQGDDLSQAWEAAAPEGDAELLAATHEQLLMWSETRGTLWALDAADGQQAWTPRQASELLEPLGTVAAREAQRPAEQVQFMQMIDVQAPIVVRGGQVVIERRRPETGYLVAVGDAVVCIADRVGGLVGIDRQTGRVLWQKTVPVERVAGIRAEGDAVAISGTSGVGTDAMSGVVAILDLLSGEDRVPLIEDKDPPQWVGFAGDDLFFVATTDQVTAHRMSDGGVIWRRSVTGATLTGQGWSSPDAAVLALNGDGLIVLDADTGETLTRQFRFAVPGAGIAPPQLVDDQWHLLAAGWAAALTPTGQTRWRDAVQSAGDHLTHQLLGERYVVLVSHASEAPARPIRIVIPRPEPRPRDLIDPPQDPDTGYRLYVLDRLTGQMVDEYQLALDGFALDPLRGIMLPNHVVLAAGDRVLVVPGSR